MTILNTSRWDITFWHSSNLGLVFTAKPQANISFWLVFSKKGKTPPCLRLNLTQFLLLDSHDAPRSTKNTTAHWRDTDRRFIKIRRCQSIARRRRRRIRRKNLKGQHVSSATVTLLSEKEVADRDAGVELLHEGPIWCSLNGYWIICCEMLRENLVREQGKRFRQIQKVVNLRGGMSKNPWLCKNSRQHVVPREMGMNFITKTHQE